MEQFLKFFSIGIPQIVLIPLLIIGGVTLFVGLSCNRIDNKKAFTLWVLLAEYLIIVCCSTVICRVTPLFAYAKLELTPFWTYMAVTHHTPGVSVWDIVLNVVLFVPLGLLVKLLFPELSLTLSLLIAAGCSVLIETNQYIFEKGIAQIDDVMHNVLGAAIGWLMAKIAMQWKTKQVSSTSF